MGNRGEEGLLVKRRGMLDERGLRRRGSDMVSDVDKEFQRKAIMVK